MRVYVRTDSSYLIGSGHVMRCISLAEILRSIGAEIHFICRDLEGNLNKLITSFRFNVHVLPPPKTKPDPSTNDVNNYCNWLGVTKEQDSQDTKNVIKNIGDCDLLIVDHYSLDFLWEASVKSISNKIMVIDDLHNRKHECDMILDQNLIESNGEEYNDLVNNICIKLIGPRYSLLRNEFKLARPFVDIEPRNIENVLIFFGGSDIPGLTLKTLKTIINNNYSFKKINVVIGQSNKNSDEIRDLCSNHQMIVIYNHVDDMAKMMLDSDLAIGASGTSQWERCCLALPSLVVSLADNQIPIANSLSTQGAVIYLGTSDAVNENRIHQQLNDLVENPQQVRSMARKSSELVDGQGSERVVMSLIQLLSYEPVVRLREVNQDDKKWIFFWQTQPDIRKFSRVKQAPSWSQHCVWFEQIPETHLWFRIICFQKYPVGMVRLLRKSHNGAYEISILINQEFHGIGIASQALRLCLQENSSHKIYAYIDPENIASLKLFQSNGFTKIKDGYIWGYQDE